MNPKGFFGELKRRHVYKVAVAYAVVSWLLIQVATQVFPFFEIPNWAVRFVVLLLILGFPVALILSWAFEITPEGIKRESEVAPEQSKTLHTGRRIVGLTIVVAVIAAGLLGFQLLRSKSAVAPQHDGSPVRTEAATAELKQRNIYNVAVAYAVVGWLVVPVATQVFPFFEISNWAVRLIVLGVPIALVIAWAFELTARSKQLG
jgi:hypothetical protein